MTKEILERLDALAAKLGVAGQELWRIFLKQAQVEIWQDGIWLVAILGLTYLFARWGLFLHRDEDKRDDFIGLIITCLILFVIGAVVSLSIMNGLVTVIMNPEYRALELLKDAIKQ